MSPTRVTVPLTLRETPELLTILFVHQDVIGQFSVVRVPRKALKRVAANTCEMADSVAEYISKNAARHEGTLLEVGPRHSIYVYGPFKGRYYDIMGRDVSGAVRKASALFAN